MQKPSAIKNPRILLTYIPRDTGRVRGTVRVGGWAGFDLEVDMQIEMFTPEQTGATIAHTELVEVAADSFGTGSAYRIADLDEKLWWREVSGGKRYAREDSECPVAIAILSESGRVEGYAREWRVDGCLAAEIVSEQAL